MHHVLLQFREVLANNEKYIELVLLLDKGGHKIHCKSENNHPLITSNENCKAVQVEKKKRNDGVKTGDGCMRIFALELNNDRLFS